MAAQFHIQTLSTHAQNFCGGCPVVVGEFQCGLDEAGKQRMRIQGARLQFRMVLDADPATEIAILPTRPEGPAPTQLTPV